MLVLTRKLMEKLYIGDQICVTVVRLEGGQVRLGIEAPREVPVIRAELLDGRPRHAHASSQVGHIADLAPQPVVAGSTMMPLGNELRARSPLVLGTGSQRRVPSR